MLARTAVNLQHELEVSESRYLKLSLTKEGPKGNKVQVNKHIKETYAGMLEKNHHWSLDTKLTKNKRISVLSTNSECKHLTLLILLLKSEQTQSARTDGIRKEKQTEISGAFYMISKYFPMYRRRWKEKLKNYSK